MVTNLTLDNGIRLVTETMPSLRSVSVGVWIASGSRHERTGEAGLAHFLEHMVFKGTETRSAERISLEVDRVGGDLNARTDREMVGYSVRVPDAHFDMAVDLLSDMVSHPALAPQAVETERQVIIEEIKRYDDAPEELAADHLIEILWPGNTAGAPITGGLADVVGTTRQGLERFHQNHYRAANTVVSVAGRFDAERARELAERLLSDLPAGQPDVGGVTPAVAAQGAVRCTTRDLEQVHLVLGWGGCGACAQERYAQAMVDGMFGATTSSRLFLRIREERGLVYSVWSEPALLRETGALIVCADSSPGNVPEVLRLILAEARSLAEGRFEADELEVAREQFKGSTALSLESTDSRETRNARGVMYLGRPLAFEEVEGLANAVTRDEAEAMAGRLFGSGMPCVAAVGPIDEKELRAALEAAAG